MSLPFSTSHTDANANEIVWADWIPTSNACLLALLVVIEAFQGYTQMDSFTASQTQFPVNKEAAPRQLEIDTLYTTRSWKGLASWLLKT